VAFDLCRLWFALCRVFCWLELEQDVDSGSDTDPVARNGLF